MGNLAKSNANVNVSLSRNGWAALRAERAALLRQLDAAGWQWDPQLSRRLDAVDARLEGFGDFDETQKWEVDDGRSF